MSDRDRDRLIALAGLYQATLLVAQTARTGVVDNAPFSATIESVFALDADTVADIYGGVPGIALGLAELERSLRAPPGRSREALQYAVAVLHLERRLSHSPERLAALREDLEQAAVARDPFGATHANVLARLAEVYTTHIATLGPRVMVKGEPGLLAQDAVVNRIRALLLAAVRAAVLWRQVGGSRIGVLLYRRRYLEQLRQLLMVASRP